MKDEIKGISCEAKNCIHHDMSNACTAGHIKVGKAKNGSGNEPNCETFECCDGCVCE